MAAFKNNIQGFTLVELLIVTSLSVILMLSASALFLTFLVGDNKVSAVKLVKDEGNYALSQMEFLLRNAVEIVPNSLSQTCETGMGEIAIKSVDDGITTLTKEEDGGKDKIASNSGIYLTSGSVDLITGPVFDCSQSDDLGAQFVSVSFTLRKGTPGVDLNRDIVEETFTSSVNVRSF